MAAWLSELADLIEKMPSTLSDGRPIDWSKVPKARVLQCHFDQWKIQVNTWEDLARVGEAKLREIYGFGLTSLVYLREQLESLGLTLGR